MKTLSNLVIHKQYQFDDLIQNLDESLKKFSKEISKSFCENKHRKSLNYQLRKKIIKGYKLKKKKAICNSTNESFKQEPEIPDVTECTKIKRSKVTFPLLPEIDYVTIDDDLDNFDTINDNLLADNDEFESSIFGFLV